MVDKLEFYKNNDLCKGEEFYDKDSDEGRDFYVTSMGCRWIFIGWIDLIKNHSEKTLVDSKNVSLRRAKGIN